jgi:PST family polysaccharide transporter
MSFLWYFQGMERMKLVASLDIFARGSATALIFLFIRRPEQIPLVFLFYAGANVISLGVSLGIASRQLNFSVVPPLLYIWQVLRDGFPLFQIRLASNIYAVGNVFILGLLTSPVVAGLYAGADKIVKALLVILYDPLNRAIFPRQSYLIKSDTLKAERLLRIGFFGAVGAGILLMIFLLFFAPIIVRLLLGEGFEGAVEVVRLLALLAPLLAISSVLGNQWLLPLGYDKSFAIIVWIAAVIDIIFALIFVPRLHQTGMALAAIITEGFISLSIILTLHRRGLLKPLWRIGRIPVSPSSSSSSAQNSR